MKPSLTALILASFWVLFPSANADTYRSEASKDLNLRSLGKLRMINRFGQVSVQGWSLDRIRVVVKKELTAENEAQAQVLMKQLDFRFTERGNEIELTSDVGKGLGLKEKMALRKKLPGTLHFFIKAPSHLNLNILASDQLVTVRNWNESVSVQSMSGGIELEKIEGKKVEVACISCDLHLRQVQTKEFRAQGGSGSIDIQKLKAEKVFIETLSGSQYLRDVSGKLILVSQSGKINLGGFSGQIDFKTDSGDVAIEKMKGFLSGTSESGKITIEVLKWNFFDKAVIESETGDVRVTLPSTFLGELQVEGEKNKIINQFTTQRSSNDILKIASRHGKVSVLKWTE